MKHGNEGLGKPGRNGIYVEKLTEAEKILVQHIDLPWRDAFDRKPLPRDKVAPHKCRIERRDTTIKGSLVTVEWRH